MQRWAEEFLGSDYVQECTGRAGGASRNSPLSALATAFAVAERRSTDGRSAGPRLKTGATIPSGQMPRGSCALEQDCGPWRLRTNVWVNSGTTGGARSGPSGTRSTGCRSLKRAEARRDASSKSCAPSEECAGSRSNAGTLIRISLVAKGALSSDWYKITSRRHRHNTFCRLAPLSGSKSWQHPGDHNSCRWSFYGKPARKRSSGSDENRFAYKFSPSQSGSSTSSRCWESRAKGRPPSWEAHGPLVDRAVEPEPAEPRPGLAILTARWRLPISRGEWRSEQLWIRPRGPNRFV